MLRENGSVSNFIRTDEVTVVGLHDFEIWHVVTLSNAIVTKFELQEDQEKPFQSKLTWNVM